MDLHLLRLLAMPGVAGDLPVFQRKLASLAWLGISAAPKAAVSACCRRAPGQVSPLTAPRLLVVPRGLEQAAQSFGDGAFTAGSSSLRVACEILAQLRKAFGPEEGRERLLDVAVDCGVEFQEQAPRAQLRMARDLLYAAGAGQAACRAATSDPMELRQHLEYAWRQGETRRTAVFCSGLMRPEKKSHPGVNLIAEIVSPE